MYRKTTFPTLILVPEIVKLTQKYENDITPIAEPYSPKYGIDCRDASCYL